MGKFATTDVQNMAPLPAGLRACWGRGGMQGSGGGGTDRHANSGEPGVRGRGALHLAGRVARTTRVTNLSSIA